ncbi:12629_t:CDS:2 [Racocetra persica]|uniref:12629_t:CDS:1 n=1 Tax=Racocetra persica TaxID=160502 RepID=A0ACA9LF22_9GLOM|nr:12629_t:CDS:2 [Racocetra persica]
MITNAAPTETLFPDFFSLNPKVRRKNSPSTRSGDRHKKTSKTRYREKVLIQELETLGFVCKRNQQFTQGQYLLAHLIMRQRRRLEQLLAGQPRLIRRFLAEIKASFQALRVYDRPDEPGRRSLACLAFTHPVVLSKVQGCILDFDPNKKLANGEYKLPSEKLRQELTVLVRKYHIPAYWQTPTPGNSHIPWPKKTHEAKGFKIYHPASGYSVGDGLGPGRVEASEKVLNTIFLSRSKNSVVKTAKNYPKPNHPKQNPLVIKPGERKQVRAKIVDLIADFRAMKNGTTYHKVRFCLDKQVGDCFLSYHREQCLGPLQSQLDKYCDLTLRGGQSLT